jgi:hypothetical protein
MKLMGSLILSAIFELLRHGLFESRNKSPVKNIGMMLSYFLAFAQEWEMHGSVEGETDWTSVVVILAEAWEIEIVGPDKVMEYVEEIRENVSEKAPRDCATRMKWIEVQQKTFGWKSQVSIIS